MLVICPIHGPQPGVMISQDLWVPNENSSRSGQIVDLIYICEDVLAWAFYVSANFAAQHGLSPIVAPLPDQPGEWARELCCCCSRCFQKAHGGHFDKMGRWYSGNDI